MKARTVVAVGVAAALAVPAFAQAAPLPKDTNNSLIVPQKSVGALKLNSTIAQAYAAWGKVSSCNAGGCDYGSQIGSSGQASFQLAKTTETNAALVVSITIAISRSSTGKANFKTPLSRYRTAKGIGLDSSVKELKRAYPHLTANAGAYFLKGAGESSTLFLAEKGRVEEISTRSVQLG
jgi:hypothetical protein